MPAVRVELVSNLAGALVASQSVDAVVFAAMVQERTLVKLYRRRTKVKSNIL